MRVVTADGTVFDSCPPYDNGPPCGHSQHSELVACPGCGSRGSAFQVSLRTVMTPSQSARFHQHYLWACGRPGTAMPAQPVTRARGMATLGLAPLRGTHAKGGR